MSKLLSLILFTGVLLGGCSAPSNNSDEVKRKADEVLDDIKKRQESLYVDKVGQECDLVLTDSGKISKAFYTITTDEKNKFSYLKFYSLDKKRSDHLSLGLMIEGRSLGYLNIKLSNKGDGIFTASEFLSANNDLTYLNIELDEKVNEIKASKKVTTLPTPNKESSEVITNWFTLTNCIEKTKKSLKGL